MKLVIQCSFDCTDCSDGRGVSVDCDELLPEIEARLATSIFSAVGECLTTQLANVEVHLLEELP